MTPVVAGTTDEWRTWLTEHGRSESEVWLVIQHKNSPTPGPRYPEAIEHALCFGWIDGLHRSHDADSSVLRFTPRNPRSTWSRTNRQRALHMIEQGLMTEHGQVLIDTAKRGGTWQVLSDEDSSSVPADLLATLDQNPLAGRNFQNFPPSSRRLILEWIAGAKRPQTRQRRIEKTVELAEQDLRAQHPESRACV